MDDGRLARQIAFLIEADKLKSVTRRTPLADASRAENSAEHSWHLVLAVMVLREHVGGGWDLLRVVELLAVHDLVEIDAGDTFAYDAPGQLSKAAREQAAAARIFGILPDDQARYMRALWDEFEAHDTIESRVANAVDRLQPLLLNGASGGGSWRAHDVTRAQVLVRIAPIEAVFPGVWRALVQIVEAFTASGMLRGDVAGDGEA
jgi:putative hydrolase of HD superfamily